MITERDTSEIQKANFYVYISDNPWQWINGYKLTKNAELTKKIYKQNCTYSYITCKFLWPFFWKKKSFEQSLCFKNGIF